MKNFDRLWETNSFCSDDYFAKNGEIVTDRTLKKKILKMTSSVESDSEIGEFGERYSEPSSDATEQNVTHQQVRNKIILASYKLYDIID